MEHSAATHRAVLSDDAVTKMMSFLEPTEDRKAVLTCKTWSTCWRRRCRGLLRVVGQRIGRFPNVTHVSPHGGGVVVSNYDDNSLEAYSPEGRGAVHVATYVFSRPREEIDDAEGLGNFHLPSVMALRGDGTAWVILGDDFADLACVRLGATVSEQTATEQCEPIMKIDFSELPEDHALFGFLPVDLALAGDRLLVLCCGPEDAHFGRVQVLDNQTGALLHNFGTTCENWQMSCENWRGEPPENWQDELRKPSCLAVHEQYCFVADTHNQAVKVFDWRDGTLVRAFGQHQEGSWAAKELMQHWTPGGGYATVPYYKFGNDYYDAYRKGYGPGAFITPCGIAVRDGKLYVSELEGRRIQVFRLPDDMRGSDLNLRPRLSMTSMELLQTIPSPDGWPLGGLCFDDAGRLWCVGPGVTWMGPNANHAFKFDTTIHFDDPDAYLHVFEPCCR